jgi:hypothetical protein
MTVAQLIEKFPPFTDPKVAVFRRTHHWTLSWASWIQFTPNFFNIRFNTILPFMPRSPKWSLLFRNSKTFYAFPLSPMCAPCPTNLILLDFIILIYLMKSTNYEDPNYIIFSLLVNLRHWNKLSASTQNTVLLNFSESLNGSSKNWKFQMFLVTDTGWEKNHTVIRQTTAQFS